MDETDTRQECPLCGGPCSLLGVLGNREHYRCRNCGADCSIEHVEPLGDPDPYYPPTIRPDGTRNYRVGD